MNKTLKLVDESVAVGMIVKIKTGEDFGKAAGLLTQLNRQLDAVVAEKQKVTKPLNEALKAERERFAPYEKKLEGAIEQLRSEMSGYQMRLLAVQREVQKKIAAGDIKDLGKAVAKITKAGEGLVGKEGVEVVGGGLVKFRVDKVVRVVDVGKIPREYMIVDEKKVREALLSEVEVPGVVLEEVQTVVNRR